MRLKRPKLAERRRPSKKGVVAAYGQWRRECFEVRNAYRRWVGASAPEKSIAFDAYNAALDREERAASRYARLMGRAGQVHGPGCAELLARIQMSSQARKLDGHGSLNAP
jgi:hypothetical protein